MRLVVIPTTDMGTCETIEISLGSKRKRKNICRFTIDYVPVNNHLRFSNSVMYYSPMTNIYYMAGCLLVYLVELECGKVVALCCAQSHSNQLIPISAS